MEEFDPRECEQSKPRKSLYKMRGTQRQLTRGLAEVLKWAPEVTRGVPQECETRNTVTTVAGQ
ncbi:hypothetical protein M405DRAFT_834214 [Rhizopogon salebrosus TDB-379]|nr:hypothetical protein M405DRAFT_834214 [Rhizopogon salebrosus TDB-379]